MKPRLRLWMGLALAASPLAGCNPRVTIEPLEVKPIEVTLNINIKVDRELDKFFDFEDKPATEPAKGGPATAPAQGGM